MTKYLYAGSWDPLTKAHIQIYNQASELGEVTFALSRNEKKEPLFRLMEREWMIRQCIPSAKTVIIEGSTALYAKNQGFTLVRGLRPNDNSEIVLAQVNRAIGVNTILIPTSTEFSDVSSTLVKGVSDARLPLSQYVEPIVEHALQIKTGRYPIAVSGSIGAGKSTLCKTLVKYFKIHGFKAHHIDLDQIAKDVRANAVYNIEAQLVDAFGSSDREFLVNAICSPTRAETLRGIFKPAIEMEYNRVTKDMQGILLVEGGVIAKYGLKLAVHGIYMQSTETEQNAALADRGVGFDLKLMQDSIEEFENLFETSIVNRQTDFAQLTRTMLCKVDTFGYLRLTQAIGEFLDLDTVINRYNKPNFYHCWTHIVHGLNEIWMNGIESMVLNAAWVTHDMFEDGSPESVQKTAQLVERRCTGSEGFTQIISDETQKWGPHGQDIHDAILSTDWSGKLQTEDPTGKMMHLDFLLFSEPPDVYREKVKLIRREYSQFTDKQWAIGRTEVLVKLKESIVSAGLVYEAQALENIDIELDSLKGAIE